MSIGLPVSSAASGLLLGCLLTGVLVGEEPSPPVSSTSGFLGTTVGTTTAGASVADFPRRAGDSDENDFRLWVGVALAALVVFTVGYGFGAWTRAPSQRRERARPRVLDGVSLAGSPHRSPVSGRSELRAREDARVACARHDLAVLNAA